MQNLKLVLVTFLFLMMTALESQAQVVYRQPGYSPIPTRPYPGYRPLPPGAPFPDYRPVPAPRPLPDYRPFPDDYSSRGRVSCTAADKGWEEHWLGHDSCGDCLRHHGSCIETCREEREVCEVEGTDYYGRTVKFQAMGFDRWSAEAEARRRCEWDRDMRSCIVTSCKSESQTLSRRSCR